MRISQKILIYFSSATLLITGAAFLFIYLLLSENREEEFQMRQKEKITTTLNLLTQIKETEAELITEIDQLTIHDLYDERLLLFNSRKELIYSSIDDTPVPFSKELLSKLNAQNKWIETQDGLYDVIGTYVESNKKTYFGISKAYDTFGYSKLRYLKYVLIFTFITISIIVIWVSFYLSKRITQDLVIITKKISSYNFESEYQPIDITESQNEINILAQQFNKLMKRMNEVYSFQKHAIHHISHELKTPIAVLVSNFERIEKETDAAVMKTLIKAQKEDTKSLSEIINSLLEIAKAETGNIQKQDNVRIDELIFDVVDELKNIYPDFQFFIEYEQTDDENSLMLAVNARLIKSALMNLIQNTVQYSNDNKAKIAIGNNSDSIRVSFENNGTGITENEQQFLFQHFFRGKNSRGKRGFGLGLVLVHKIIALHNGTISYDSYNNASNTFITTLPLS